MISRLRRNAEPDVDVLPGMAHPRLHREPTLDVVVDADMILETLDTVGVVDRYQNIPDEPDVEPDATSMYDIRMSAPAVGPIVDEEPTTTRPSVLMLVEFSCPLCHLPIVAEQHRGHLRVPDHQISTPIYPHGFGGPLFRAACPASGMPISEMCTGSHRPPACSDPRCLVQEDEAIATDGGDGDGGDGGGDEDDLAAPVPVDAWPADEHTAQGAAYPSDPEPR